MSESLHSTVKMNTKNEDKGLKKKGKKTCCRCGESEEKTIKLCLGEIEASSFHFQVNTVSIVSPIELKPLKGNLATSLVSFLSQDCL